MYMCEEKGPLQIMMTLSHEINNGSARRRDYSIFSLSSFCCVFIEDISYWTKNNSLPAAVVSALLCCCHREELIWFLLYSPLPFSLLQEDLSCASSRGMLRAIQHRQRPMVNRSTLLLLFYHVQCWIEKLSRGSNTCLWVRMIFNSLSLHILLLWFLFKK